MKTLTVSSFFRKPQNPTVGRWNPLNSYTYVAFKEIFTKKITLLLLLMSYDFQIAFEMLDIFLK